MWIEYWGGGSTRDGKISPQAVTVVKGNRCRLQVNKWQRRQVSSLLYFAEGPGNVKLSNIVILLLFFYKLQWRASYAGLLVGWPAVRWVFTTRIVAP